MPGDDLVLDDSGDYVDDGAGGFQVTPTAASAVRHQGLDRLGEWVGDVTAGREQAGIAGRQDTEAELDAEANSWQIALELLEIEGLITDIQIETDRDVQGRFGLKITSRDTSSGGTITIETLGEFGG